MISLKTTITKEQIEEQLNLARTRIDNGVSECPGDSFEEGVVATLEWLLAEQGGDAPLSFDSTIDPSDDEDDFDDGDDVEPDADDGEDTREPDPAVSLTEAAHPGETLLPDVTGCCGGCSGHCDRGGVADAD